VRTKYWCSRLKFLKIGLILVIGGSLLAGCHKVVRVQVTDEDIVKANAVSQEGDLAFNRRDYYSALIKYLESSRLNPNNGYVINKLGIAYLQLRYYPEAANAFMRSIELNPKYSSSYNNLGSVYFAQKNLKKAERYYKKALGMKDDEASFHMNLGSLYFEKKKYEKGKEEWRKGLALDRNVLKSTAVSLVGNSSSSAERRYFMAQLMASSGDVDSAIENLKQAITEGFANIDAIRKEPEFDGIRGDKRFIDFMENAEILVKLRSQAGTREQ
jgi:tetratricopeptide (TPR) repeat protein